MSKKNMEELMNLFDGILTSEEIRTTELLAHLSSKIIKCRLDRKMTQKEFAELLEISQPMVSKIESEEYNFTIGMLVKICCKLGLELEVKISDPKEELNKDSIFDTNRNFYENKNNLISYVNEEEKKYGKE